MRIADRSGEFPNPSRVTRKSSGDDEPTSLVHLYQITLRHVDNEKLWWVTSNLGQSDYHISQPNTCVHATTSSASGREYIQKKATHAAARESAVLFLLSSSGHQLLKTISRNRK
ncbi:hypothetical protein TorRG33x02_217380 [Trema orientale]|uniref:Uncharacterized protein n=1 Tax=Trema orientale TaxID=63057 RepID=A0A2P5EAC1_TREOI|nr:hypothetical protein TorRG33x02_217380 [Trema orientale]